MKIKLITTLNRLVIAALMAALPVVWAHAAADTFTTEPDKSLAAAHESFLKGDMNKASQQIHRAAAAVKKDSRTVAADSKDGMNKAGAALDKLGDDVKTGTVKSDAELKMSFAKVDHQIAGCWHQTAAESRKSGKDASADLKKAGQSLSGAAKWSGTELNEGTHSTVEEIKKVGVGTGKDVKASSEKVDKWFKDIGDGISDLGHKL